MKQRSGARFWLLVVVLCWLTHALGYLTHEYAHSFSAWAFGYKANPLALDYGHLTPGNLIFLAEVDENVAYDPIFAAGRGRLASLVAVSGVLVGNGVFYFAARGLYSFARRRRRRTAALFGFLYCLMNVGNFLCYVPIRAFATHADMATVEKGLNVSPWWVTAVLGIPFAVAIWHFFARLLPDTWSFLLPGRRLQRAALLTMSSFAVFVFYGSAGLRGYGDVSRWLSIVSACLMFPAVTILCWPRKTGRQVRQGPGTMKGVETHEHFRAG